MAEEEIAQAHEIRDCAIMKLDVKIFGDKAKSMQQLYPDTKVLVFCKEPWKVVGMSAATVNENLLYVLAKWREEYVIVAEKRLGELQMRTGHKFKKLLAFNGDALDELVLAHPFTSKDLPVLVDNEVAAYHGTGIDCVAPAHEMHSLKVAYHYDLSKEGCVDDQGKFTEEAGVIFAGLSVFDEGTNELVTKMLQEEDALLCQYPFKNEFYEDVETGEKIILRSSKSWFLQISEQLKSRCFDELSTTLFCPKLNIKDAE